MKITLVRLTSLGDIILSMAALQTIRRALPDSHITWVADKRFADILECQPDIQNIVRVDLKGLKKQKTISSALAAEYRALTALGPSDIVIDLHGMIKSAVVAAIIGGKKYGFARGMRKESLAGLFYHHGIPVPLEEPAVCRYASLAAHSLGFDFLPACLTPPQPYLFWKLEHESIADAYFSRERKNIIFICGSSASYKNYPPEKLSRLANLLKENILLCYGNGQELQTATLIAEKSAYARVLPSLSLNQLKATIGRADLVIGGDTGPTHIAWACGVPSITLFGATPVCIMPTEFNKVIKTSSSVNLRKPDPTDNSVGSIEEDEIMKLACELLK